MRARLMDAAIASVAHDGLAGASIERITRRAGVSRGLVRHYYGTKSNLLAEAFCDLANDLRRTLGMSLVERPHDDTGADVRFCEAITLESHGLEAALDRQYAWFGFWALGRSDPRIAELIRGLYEEIVAHLGRLLADVARTRGRTIDAAAAGRALAAMVEGARVHCIIGIEGMSLQEARRLCLDWTSRLVVGESDGRTHEPGLTTEDRLSLSCDCNHGSFGKELHAHRDPHAQQGP
jgi:AcrR family transcriptional regulator